MKWSTIIGYFTKLIKLPARESHEFQNENQHASQTRVSSKTVSVQL